MLNTLSQTLRALRRAPWYTGTVVGVIALGMALATTVFAVVDGVLFKPIALPGADRLFTIQAGFKDQPLGKYHAVSRGDLGDWAAAVPGVFFTGFRAQSSSGFGEGVNNDDAGVARVQPNVFDVLGVRPMIGGFADADFADVDYNRPIMYPVIATYDVWLHRFHGDSGILGRTFSLDASKHVGYRIVGVMPRGFLFPSENVTVKFLMPAARTSNPRDREFGEVIARVTSGMGADGLRARVEAAMAVTATTFPQGPKPAGWSDAGWRHEGPPNRAEIVPLAESLGSRSRPLFRAVFLAVVVLVAIGALNVSGLMAARTLDRMREIGVRRALGASNVLIARLVFVEALTLVVVGSLLGLLAAWPLLRMALSLLPDETVLLKPAVIDWRAAIFVVAGAIALAIPAAIWPTWRAAQSHAALPSHGDAGRASERTRSVGRFLIVTSQVAGGFVLTLSGSLLVGSLLSVYANDLPIQTHNVLLVEATLGGPGEGMGKSPARNPRMGPLIDRLRQVTGVGAVAITSGEILQGGGWGSRFNPPVGARPLSLDDVDAQGVTSDYYRVMQPQVMAGRLPTDQELAQGARVLVVSERLASAYWPGDSAVGRTLSEQGDPVPYTVVGVVKDVRWFAWDTEVTSIYGPYALLSRAPLITLMIQTQGRTGQVTADVLGAIHDADPLVKPTRAAPLSDLFVDSVRGRRFQAWLFGGFAAAGLAIVGVGILGLLAMATARRVKEIGIRHALGATSPGIVLMLLREQLFSVFAGLAAGGVLSAWVVTLVEKYLYRITTFDPRVWATAAALILATSAIGALIPAVRASRTNPVQALKAE